MQIPALSVNASWITHVCEAAFAVISSVAEVFANTYPSRMLSRRWFVGIAFVYTAVFLLQVRCAPAQRPVSEVLPFEQLRSDEGLTDLRTDGGPDRRGIPPSPSDWQKKPPCPKEMGERAINGACYFRIHPDDMKPPCMYPALEHDGQCWRAVAKVQREPSSVVP